ncbi:hypothetical protein PG999_012225 [Apiospora kogelbergensis]|uniref:Uncharacterized protein n=1 Tax=Apiospora kogelbergensis TaxID=1337665 RepID=A0AAW0QHM3_9PEZI
MVQAAGAAVAAVENLAEVPATAASVHVAHAAAAAEGATAAGLSQEAAAAAATALAAAAAAELDTAAGVPRHRHRRQTLWATLWNSWTNRSSASYRVGLGKTESGSAPGIVILQERSRVLGEK